MFLKTTKKVIQENAFDQKKKKPWLNGLRTTGPCRGPFLESPGNFSGPKSDFQIEIQRIRARVLANKLLLFVSLTDSFIMLNAKLLKPLSCM